MKKVISVFFAAVILLSSLSVPAFAVTPDECTADINSAYSVLFNGVVGDINSDGVVSAADARAALLASAGLKEDGCDESKADVDADGSVTAIDARMILRVSAKLDSESTLVTANQLKLFNALANNIKASGDRVRYSNYTKNLAIDCTNEALLNDLSEDMNKAGQMMGESESFDVVAEFKKDEGKVTWVKSTLPSADSERFPVSGQDFVSKLSVSDIATIEYKTNQSYRYNHTSIVGGVERPSEVNSATLTGLDSITITFANENVKTMPSDMTTLKHGKVFDIPDADSLSAEYNTINNMFAGLEDLIGTFSLSFGYLNFYNSYVTIYFDHDTRKVCAAEYNLYYDFAQKLDIDLQFLLAGIDVEGTASIIDKEYTRYSCYMPDNHAAALNK